MDENLKSIRRIHYAVVGVSIAVIAIGLTPSRAQKYNAALAEAALFEELDLTWMWPDAQKRAQMLRDSLVSLEPLAFALWQNARGNGVEFEFPDSAMPSPEAVAYMHRQDPQAPVFPKTHFLPPLPLSDSLKMPAAPKDTTVSGIMEYVHGNTEVFWVRPRPLPGESSLRMADELACPTVVGIRRCRIERIISAGSDSLGFYLILKLYSWKDSFARVDTMRFGGEERFVADVRKYLLQRPRRPGNRIWLLRTGTGEEDSMVVKGFPSLAKLRSEVKDLRRNELRGYLTSRSIESRQRTQMLGVFFDEQFIALAGPIFLILSMVYLYLHLSHLRTICTYPDLKFLRMFPWSPLYPGRNGDAVGAVSLLMLPTIAVLVVTISAWTALPLWIDGLHVLATILTPVAGALCLSRVQTLRRSLREDGIDVTEGECFWKEEPYP
jgi:hypothetical protein